MRRFIGIIFICIYLVSFMEGYQLFKLPVLVQHLKEHRKAEPGMSFYKFIRIHYIGPDIVYDDFQRDQHLPFRTADILIYQVTCIAKSDYAEPGITPPADPGRHFNGRYSSDISYITAFDIFQPPRCA